jgi:hypothetical protein
MVARIVAKKFSSCWTFSSSFGQQKYAIACSVFVCLGPLTSLLQSFDDSSFLDEEALSDGQGNKLHCDSTLARRRSMTTNCVVPNSPWHYAAYSLVLGVSLSSAKQFLTLYEIRPPWLSRQHDDSRFEALTNQTTSCVVPNSRVFWLCPTSGLIDRSDNMMTPARCV